MDGQCKFRWTLYITLASLFIFVSVTEVGPFSSMKETVFSSHSLAPQYRYAVVFDAGSTGTRIHIFTFVNSSSGLLTLKDEYFEEVKPGLSGFADAPKNATYGLSHLLKKAKSHVPSNSWGKTPVSLKATAGLRLLPSHSSNSLLHEVSKVFKNSPFVSDGKSVTILDGESEGIYAWYTLNFLLERLNDTSRSVASLDLGGGSTQVTFLPVDLDTLVFSPKGYVIRRKVQNKTMSIYTHSYLGLGLMSARLSILKMSSEKSNDSKSEEQSSFSSYCIHPNTKATWKHDLKEYIVMGRKDGKYSYESCYNIAVDFLGNNVDNPDELARREIYALSYYFDRAVDLGLVDESGGLQTVGHYIYACQNACSKANLKEPYLCLDCSYITAFLHHGLGFDNQKEIMLVKQINGIETSWGLGAAFDML